MATRRRSVLRFSLTGLWRKGELLVRVAEDTSLARCDRSTMTRDDIDNERVVCFVGIAPVSPAKFVIIRIGQWTAENRHSGAR